VRRFSFFLVIVVAPTGRADARRANP